MRIAIDLDGTICPTKEGNDYRDYAHLEPYPGAAERIRQLRSAGHTVIILTARNMGSCSSNLGMVVARVGKITLDWLERHGIEYDEIYFGKPHAEVYLDDRALRFTSWDEVSEASLKAASRPK